MTQVSVRNLNEGKPADLTLLNSLNGMIQSIQNRAFQLSQQNGGSGSLDNWLQAERELFLAAQSELTETDREFRIQVSVPGIDAKDLEVSVLGTSITITTTSSRQQTSSANTPQSNTSMSNPGVRFSEFNSKPLFRRIDLGGSVSSGISGQTTAMLDNGLLSISVSKTASDSRTSAARA